jgi:small redox-active disulfide protein 2
MLNIKILGSGCTNCKNLEKLCNEVVAENNINAEIEKVTDYKEIMKYGIMSTPGLVLNGKVILSGKLPTKSTLSHWLTDSFNEDHIIN